VGADGGVTVLRGVLEWFADPANWQGPDGVPARTLEHLWYSLVATVSAAVLALPIGLGLGHTGRGGQVAINLTNLGRAIPSLGIIILAFFVAGIGFVPVLVTLVALALPPIVTNSFVGIRAVDPEIRDAAEGVGMTGWQVLTRVEIPVALPLIMAGVRTSAVQVIATATLAAFVSLGGLGRYIIDGLSQRNTAEVVAGALLVAALSLLVELGLAAAQRSVTPAGLAGAATRPSAPAAPAGQPI
jgi:osmoprotectant transport system permease protein